MIGKKGRAALIVLLGIILAVTPAMAAQRDVTVTIPGCTA